MITVDGYYLRAMLRQPLMLRARFSPLIFFATRHYFDDAIAADCRHQPPRVLRYATVITAITC